MKRKYIRFIWVVVAAALVGCAQPQEADEVLTSTPALTATPEPTATSAPAPTATPEPTATSTPAPTATPEPTATSTPAPTATPEPTATSTPAPTATPEPTATSTPAPTATPKPTATSTPVPTATPMPTAKPTPSVSEIEVVVPTQAPGHVYTCSERGEEALEAVKALRENYSGIPNAIAKKMREEYDFSEEDVLYAVYNSGWTEKTVEWSKSALENKPYSRVGLINYFHPRWPFIEADVLYGVDNCGADWNEQAIRYVQNELDDPDGCGYLSLVKSMKKEGFTDENIEYALANMTIDWVAQAEKAIARRLESNCYSEYWLLYNMIARGEYAEADLVAAISNMEIDWAVEAEEIAVNLLNKSSYSRQALIKQMVEGERFAEDIAVAAVDKTNADWVAEAMEEIDHHLAKYTSTRLQCLERLQSSYYFTKEEAEAAIANRTDIDWKEQALRCMQNTVDKMAQSYDDLVFNYKNDCSPEELEYALANIVVDWDEEARQKAELYINSGHDGYSPEGLVDHLMSSHGFTKEQCVNAVESLGDVDWNEQAVSSMRWFMQDKHSREDLIEILRKNKFTEDQIAYALAVCNPK